MSSFEDRKKSFEKKFAHDEELQFKVSARRNKYIGEWASQILGYDDKTDRSRPCVMTIKLTVTRPMLMTKN